MSVPFKSALVSSVSPSSVLVPACHFFKPNLSYSVYFVVIVYVHGCLPTRVTVHLLYVWYSWELKEGIGTLGAGVIDSCEPPRARWESNVDPLEEQPVLFSPEPSLQSSLLSETGFYTL